MAYNWQCIGSHNGEVPKGSPLEVKARERAESGKLDAICLSENECPQCQEDKIEHLRRETRLCGDAGCPMGEDDCQRGCMVVQEMQELEAARVSVQDLQLA